MYYLPVYGLTVDVTRSYSGIPFGGKESLSLGRISTSGLIMDWDWDANPIYESDRIRIDGTHSPLVMYSFKLPRQITDEEIQMTLDVADLHLDRDLPFVALTELRRGTGVVSARQRRMFADWLDDRRERLKRDNYSAVVVLPEAIFRAVLRVVYRFRTPPIRTVTASDMCGAAEAARRELHRMGQSVTPEIDALLGPLCP